MNNATLYSKKEFTAKQADAIGAAIKSKWDDLKDWPSYRGHNEPSDYPRYIHVSVLCGVRQETDEATGVVTNVPWVNKGVTYNIGRNKAKRAKRSLN